MILHKVLIPTIIGASILGGLGFAGGFFGPMIFQPDANQGPLLGIFITGPLGFIIGGILGAVVGLVQCLRTKSRNSSPLRL